MSVILSKTQVEATLDIGSQVAEGLSISLTQPAKSTSRWLFRVRVQTDEGISVLGSFMTAPPVSPSPQTRIVAIASCPGVRRWHVDIQPAPSIEGLPATPDNSSVSLAAGCCSQGDTGGVQRVNERPKYYAGVNNGDVQVLPGEEVVSWSAWAIGAGATVQIVDVDTTNQIFLPPAGSVEGGIAGLIKGPALFRFVGTGGFLVEVAVSA
jgi:hypothetical protein